MKTLFAVLCLLAISVFADRSDAFGKEAYACAFRSLFAAGGIFQEAHQCIQSPFRLLDIASQELGLRFLLAQFATTQEDRPSRALLASK